MTTFDPRDYRSSLALIRIPTDTRQAPCRPDDDFGTGFFVTGSVLLTAAHNLTENGKPEGRLLEWVSVCSYNEADQDWSTHEEVRIDPIDVDWRLDAAILTVSARPAVKPLPLGSHWDKGDVVTVLGFQPEPHAPSGFSLHWMQCFVPKQFETVSARVPGSHEKSLRLYIDQNETPLGEGMSGGPVIKADAAGVRVLAIEKAVKLADGLRPPEVRTTPVVWLRGKLDTLGTSSGIEWIGEPRPRRRRLLGALAAAAVLAAVAVLYAWWPQPCASIDSPAAGATVTASVLVKGAIRPGACDAQMWVVVNPIGEPGWWPQVGPLIPAASGGTFQQLASFAGREGQSFQIGIVAVSDEAHGAFVKYLQDGEKSGNYPGHPLPAGAQLLTSVQVVKGR